MGCKLCCLPGPVDDLVHGVRPRAIIIWRAANLKNGDALGSDPYVVVRVGEAGTAWDEKPRSGGRRGKVADENKDPVWNFGITAETAGLTKPEVHIRVYDMDFFSEHDLLGEGKVLLESLDHTEKEVSLTGPDGAAAGSVFASGGHKDLLADNNIKAWVGYESIAPQGPVKSWSLADAALPIRVATAPMPKALRGVFWLSGQGRGTALVSFAGPSHDGGGCSTGHLQGNMYSIRCSGDRVWSWADETDKFNIWATQQGDLVYHFVFDNAEQPKNCQIYPESRALDIVMSSEWLLDYEMVLEEGVDEMFPGSVVWQRVSSILGGEKKVSYGIVQVVDEDGKRIQPAWDRFVEYQNSADAGASPGMIFYNEIQER
eukprot:CAMPEP_0176048166 /NCGR_PEP_ID=MMETSP0120_2-20121206/23924_1 /TAXON_ID=160619 /ORGANISM="Kryptoperidinium foliaceum, Strain CCMP 1326" /LENGTH=372 /DNA_ID=CAMNT_0017381581 /DNA_START=61 /DNA_END=1179 /DNA_ORIENTATION=-